MRTSTIPELELTDSVLSFILVRKKKPTSTSPKDCDLIAWRFCTSEHGGFSGRLPELVFRSPVDPNVWLSRSQYEQLTGRLESEHELVFSTRKGYRPISDPKDGCVGWKKFGEQRRFRVVFRDRVWYRIRNESSHPHSR